MKDNGFVAFVGFFMFLVGIFFGIVSMQVLAEARIRECIEMSTTGNLIQWQAEYPYCNVFVHTIDNLGNDAYIPMTIKEYNDYIVPEN